MTIERIALHDAQACLCLAQSLPVPCEGVDGVALFQCPVDQMAANAARCAEYREVHRSLRFA